MVAATVVTEATETEAATVVVVTEEDAVATAEGKFFLLLKR